MKKSSIWAVSMVMAGLTALAAPAQASYVTNGGFETGDLAGWTGTGDQDFNGVQCPGADASVNSGECSAFFGPMTLGGIQQTINVGGAGHNWSLSFAFKPDGAMDSLLEVMFGGQTLLSLLNPAEGDYRTYSFNGVTTGENMTLSFNFRDPAGFLFLDDVTLYVPEPGTIGLLGAGLAGLLAARRRKSA